MSRSPEFHGEYFEQDRENLERKAKIAKLFRAFLRAVQVTGFVLSLHTAMEVGKSAAELQKELEGHQFKVTATSTEESATQFSHEDLETTQIIDYLSGKGDAPINDPQAKIEMEKNEAMVMLVTIASGEENAVIKKTDVASVSAMRSKWKELASQTDEEAHFTDDQWLDAKFKPSRPPVNEKLYQALWEVEQAAGNPKIRWLRYDTKESGLGDLNRAFFRLDENTMYIRPPDLFVSAGNILNDYVAEASHGVQRTSPDKDVLRAIYSGMVITGLELRHMTDYKRAHDMTYDIPGTLENDAHSVIQPELEKKISSSALEAEEIESGSGTKSAKNEIEKE